jgi:hypothetical protein
MAPGGHFFGKQLAGLFTAGLWGLSREVRREVYLALFFLTTWLPAIRKSDWGASLVGRSRKEWNC